MKLRVLLLPPVGLLGLGASYALADGGHRVHAGLQGSPCPRVHLVGTVAAPQTLTVTVAKSGGDSPFAVGQVVTVSLGSVGQTVRVNVDGCSSASSSLTAREAELHVSRPEPPPDGPSRGGDAGVLTGPGGPGEPGDEDHGGGHHGGRGDHLPPSQGTTTTVGTTTTTTVATTTTTAR